MREKRQREKIVRREAQRREREIEREQLRRKERNREIEIEEKRALKGENRKKRKKYVHTSIKKDSVIYGQRQIHQ